jgi:inhibitor of cysteine peptidase
MRMLLLAAASIAVAAPSFADTAATLPAPAPAEAIQVAQGQAGETISAQVGATIAVQLMGSPSSGLSWLVAEKPEFLGTARFLTGPTTENQTRPGFVGGQRWQVYTFEVLAAGSGTLKLEQRSAQNRAAGALQTFEITIEATDPS